MSELRAGIIGCGWFGRVHLERLSEISGVFVTALSDPNLEAAQELAQKAALNQIDPAQSNIVAFANFHELLAHPGLDFVVIASPNKHHVPQILAALEKGLHVLCEKPLTLVPDEVEQVDAAMQKSGKHVAVAYQSRYRRTARLLKTALDNGTWGKVKAVNLFGSEDWKTPNIGTWRHDPERCPGGYFGDANGHQLDMLFWLTGLHATEVRATMDTCGTPVPLMTWGQATLTAQNGASPDQIPMVFQFIGIAKRWREEIVIQTEHADLLIRDTVAYYSDGSTPMTLLTEDVLGLTEPVVDDTPDSAFVATLRGEHKIVSEPISVNPVLSFTLMALADAGF